MEITCTPIGTMDCKSGFRAHLNHEYALGLLGLSGFSHALILWYADRSPVWDSRMLTVSKPYRLSPDSLGLFATRSPIRPNPLCVSVAAISRVDEKEGSVEFLWTDLEDGTPILDIKPYHPSSDRVASPTVPQWCAHWPRAVDEGMDFDWEGEFLSYSGPRAIGI